MQGHLVAQTLVQCTKVHQGHVAGPKSQDTLRQEMFQSNVPETCYRAILLCRYILNSCNKDFEGILSPDITQNLTG